MVMDEASRAIATSCGRRPSPLRAVRREAALWRKLYRHRRQYWVTAVLRELDARRAAAGPSRMPLWLGDLDWRCRPPKSVAYIRAILARIHRLVHGG